MKILVATKETQGQRKNDFCHAEEGEIVRFGFECDGETVDGHCGCKRSMPGITSQKATTTMKVVEMKITKAEFKEKIRGSLKKAGWDIGADAKKMAVQDANELLTIASHFSVGDIIEKRGNSFTQRSDPIDALKKKAADLKDLSKKVPDKVRSGS